MTVPAIALEEAVAAEVADGACVWLGNFGVQLFAVGREIIRQRRRNLHIVIGSGGLLLDELLAGGVAGEVTFAHCWSPVGPHPTRAFRAAWEGEATVHFHELPLGALSAALGAEAAGVPFAAIDLDPGTGYGEWTPSMLARVQSPFGEATVVRALRPDVAFVHAALADAWGNCALGTPAGEAPVAVAAARRTVAVAERIAATAEVAALGVTLPGVLIDAVVEHPGAAAPDGVPGRYGRDVAAYEEYVGAR
jgi:glutaconate CoA-transferase subunit A